MSVRPLRNPPAGRRHTRHDSYHGRRRRAPRGPGDQLHDEILDATTELPVETGHAKALGVASPSVDHVSSRFAACTSTVRALVALSPKGIRGILGSADVGEPA